MSKSFAEKIKGTAAEKRWEEAAAAVKLQEKKLNEGKEKLNENKETVK